MMDAELEQEIRSNFPHLLGSDAAFRFGNGWFVLMWLLLQKVDEKKWPVKIGACHEKWGWLHVQLSQDTEGCPLDIDDDYYTAVFLTEYNSYYTCEICAEPGVIRWDFEHIAVLCSNCEKTYDSPRVATTPPYDTQPGEWRIKRAAGYSQNI